MAIKIYLDSEVNASDLSRAFRTEDPYTVGRLVLTSESRTSTTGEPYNFGFINVEFAEPEQKSVGVGLIPAYEPIAPELIADDNSAMRHVSFGVHLLIDSPELI